MDYRWVYCWAENPDAKARGVRAARGAGFMVYDSGPTFKFHATVLDGRIKKVEAFIDSDPELHRYDGDPTPQSSYKWGKARPPRWPGDAYVVRSLEGAKAVAKKVADKLVQLADDLRGA